MAAKRAYTPADQLGDADGLAYGSPQWLVLGINNYCNLHCRMCDVGLGDPQTIFWSQLIGRQPRMMDPALYERILDQALEFAAPPGVALVYTEPLLHPAIGHLVAAASARGLTTSLPTNGMLLARHGAALVEAGLQHLTLSVDGPPAIHTWCEATQNRSSGSRPGWSRCGRRRRGRASSTR